jgi:microcompartment protein CcmK/EutM
VKFAQVIGTVVCVQADPNLLGIKLLVMQPLTEDMAPTGSLYVAADGVGQAGCGDIVTVVFKGDAPEAFERNQIPVDASIVGIVDADQVNLLQR